jgi:hypothetical protein
LNIQCGKEELERLYRIGAQVKRGLETIESQESKLSKEAKDVFYQIKNRFLKVYEKTENNLRLKHFDAILKEEYLKKK